MILLASDSELTCVSEVFYTEIKRHLQIRELPVANLAEHVAVGRKNIRVSEKVYLDTRIWKFNIFDWLKANAGIINFKMESVKIRDEILPSEFVNFRSVLLLTGEVELMTRNLKYTRNMRGEQRMNFERYIANGGCI